MRLLSSLAPLTLAAFVTSAAAAEPAAASSADGAPRGLDARGWLVRIHEAASRRNYQGTFVVSGGGSVVSARITHYQDGKDGRSDARQFERVESLDGRQRQVVRHNDTVYTLWPGSQVAMIEQRGLLSSFPALLQAADDHIGDWYEVQPQGRERVAGRDADLLLVRPRDAWRHGYRLWADRATGLLLRSEVLGATGDVLETSAFSEVAVGIRSEPQTVLQPMKKLDGYRVVRPQVTPTRLEDEGWSLAVKVPGFREVSCVGRRIDNPTDPAGERAGDRSPGRVIQAIYADGLTYVSVFIEPWRPDHGGPVLAAMGATLTLTQRNGDWWITVVGDTPQATLKSFASALTRRKP